ncbi:aminotransferase class I/II-fold pyridoxal phosphate-dependent enzyme [Francisella frigiditurris]|uniref:Aminotransferase class I and II family protein n=1 Tax=Francisella frigiditurris TaxID=1542390 RepID=A0A1J0KSB0_9GAMM|nr:aminotransferase class I/II-fold pyridoxal phosphate-dependent enzyme [Francisella frigiditurris]APC96669.1 aminotransferase class I and II family protein [Francisella frigiditurris]
MEVNKNWLIKRLNQSDKNLEISYDCARNTYIKSEKKRITLTDNKEYLEFISCSYLGLHNNKRLTNAIKKSKSIDSQGFLFSSSRTRCISKEEKKVLKKFSNIFYPYHPVLFQNLHTAHLGIIPLLFSKSFPKITAKTKLTCLIDKYSHQSLKILIGIIKQFCEVELIDALDTDKLSLILEKKYKENETPFIIMDSVGSMGKIYPIKEIINLINKFKGYVYFDDAHSMSILGNHGSGYVLQELNYKMNKRVFISTSLTKGFGGQGGVVLMPYQEQVDFIITYCTTYTFSGPLSIPTLEILNKACDIHLSKKIQKLQQKLKSNLAFFDKKIDNFVFNKYSNSFLPFRIIFVGNEDKAIKYYKLLKAEGILVTCAVYPVVEKSKAILRITFSASHKFSDINLLISKLKEIIRT